MEIAETWEWDGKTMFRAITSKLSCWLTEILILWPKTTGLLASCSEAKNSKIENTQREEWLKHKGMDTFDAMQLYINKVKELAHIYNERQKDETKWIVSCAPDLPLWKPLYCLISVSSSFFVWIWHLDQPKWSEEYSDRATFCPIRSWFDFWWNSKSIEIQWEEQ